MIYVCKPTDDTEKIIVYQTFYTYDPHIGYYVSIKQSSAESVKLRWTPLRK